MWCSISGGEIVEFIIAIITLIVWVLSEATIGISWNMSGIGTGLAVCIMGTAILWAVRHPKDK